MTESKVEPHGHSEAWRAVLSGEVRGLNTTARLASAAGAGEILVSAAAVDASGLDGAELELRKLELRGRDEAVEARVARVA